MKTLTAASIAAAARRLTGHLIATPLIGGLPLCASLPAADVRWKPELLQPGGSGWFRGYLHFLMRRLGGLPGLVFAGPPARALSAAVAAQHHRLPLGVVLAAAPDDDYGAALRATGAEIAIAADRAAWAGERQRRQGHAVLPGADDPDVAAGLATIGLELAADLPRACRQVYVPAEVAPAIAAGLEAAGGPPVQAVAPGAGPPELRRAVALHHRLLLGVDSAMVLGAAMLAGAGDPVGAVALE